MGAVRRHQRRLFQEGERLTFDALVVGAGPAGSACALALARAGFHIGIIEKRRFPRTKACGEYLNPGTVKRLDELGVKVAVAPCASSLLGTRVFSNGISVELPFASPAWSVPRRSLDDILLREARAAGATLLLGSAERVVDGDHPRLEYSKAGGGTERLAARLIVGADGMHSVTARAIAAPEPVRSQVRFALGGHYDGFETLDPFIELYVDKGTYVAFNPLGEHSANVIAVVSPSMLRTWRTSTELRLREHADRTSGGRRSLVEAAPSGERIASPLAFALRRMTGQNVMLIGDAGAFIDPFVGQGIFLALGSAARAARAIADILHGRRDSQSALMAYEREHRAEIFERRRLATLVRATVNVPVLARRAAARLGRTPARARALLDAVAGLAPVAPVLSPIAIARLFT